MKKKNKNVKLPKIKTKPEKYNPFEVHINKSKLQVLGQKSKDDRGLPGISRGKSYRKREKTLLEEYKNRNKDSKFLDMRIGEKNKFLDPEKKIMMRLAAEKKKQFSKRSMFSLNEDEQLTHGGQLLTDDIMKDQKTFSDDDDGEDVLQASFVKEKHFGGGLFTKTSDDAPVQGVSGPGPAKTRKEWIDEIIAESKAKKAENRLMKEEQNEAVVQLDGKFQDFLKLMSGRKITDEDKEKYKKSCEFREYDRFVTEISFDRSRRARPSERLKTADELAREEADRLRKLEEDRMRRMRNEGVRTGNHEWPSVSADALDDGLCAMSLNSRTLQDKNTVQDRDAPVRINMKKNKLEKPSRPGKSPDKDNTDDEEQSSDNESNSEDDEEQRSDNDNTDEGDQEQNSDNVAVSEDEEQNSDNEEIDEGDEENSDNEVISEDEEGKISENESVTEDAKTASENEEIDEEWEDIEEQETGGESENESDDDSDNKENIREKSEKTKQKREKKRTEQPNSEKTVKASEELPYTFEVPDDYDDFLELVNGRTPDQVSTVVQRMISCNHPSLAPGNKEKANLIFAYALQTIHGVSVVDGESLCEGFEPMSFIDSFVPHLYDMTQKSPSDAASALNQVLDEKYEEYSSCRKRTYPYADTFVFLKVAGLLFPASDYHHDVMTRVLTALTQFLGEARIETPRHVVAALFTANLLFEYLNRSKRFVGELINTLTNILFLAIPSSTSKHNLPHFPPIKSTRPYAQILVLSKKVKRFEDDKLSLSLLNQESLSTSDWLRIKLVNEALRLLSKLCVNWQHLPAVNSILEPTLELIEHLPLVKYPSVTSCLVQSVKTAVENLPKKHRPLVKMQEQVKTLKMLQPSVEKIFDGVKKRPGSHELLERQRLLHRVKREKKAAHRELKKDAQFLARERLREELRGDAERKRKVNMIMRDLAVQESEFKKLKSQK